MDGTIVGTSAYGSKSGDGCKMTPSSRAETTQPVVIVGVRVDVTEGVGILEVGLLVRVAGSCVAEGRGVKVRVAVRKGVFEGDKEGVRVQVGGRPGVRWDGAEVSGVEMGEQANRNHKMIKYRNLVARIAELL